MDPNKYYSLSDLGTIDNRKPKDNSPYTGNLVYDNEPGLSEDGEETLSSERNAQSAEHGSSPHDDADVLEDAPNVVYDIRLLSTKRPGPVLAVGYGNPLKAVVRAAANFDVTPLYTTGTDDKMRGFQFGGTSKVASIGKKFDSALFTNEFAVLHAAEECEARTILCASNALPSDLLAEECIRRGILLMVPRNDDRSLAMWERAVSPAVGSDIEAAAKMLEPVSWRRCAACGLTHDNREVVRAGFRCPSCGKLARLTTDERMALVFDEGSIQEWDTDIAETNALDFPDFDAVIERARKRSGYDEGVRTGRATIEGYKTAFGIMEPSFIMASMGHVVGERLARMFERATEEELPVIVFAASGGARMQEGLVSLMQMAKVSAAVKRHSEAGLLYISVLTDPTTGGVTASFATLGDIMLSEPGAIIGFAGRRVIQDTIKQALPDDFQTAEFALEHGLIDAIVERDAMRSTLSQILGLHVDARGVDPSYLEKSEESAPQSQSSTVINNSSDTELASAQNDDANPSLHPAIADIARGLSGLASTFGQAVTEHADKAGLWWASRNKGVADAPYMKPSQATGNRGTAGSSASQGANHAWESVQLARNVHRPTSHFYIDAMFDDFIELHGDRAYADDGAIIAGIGRINGQAVTVIAEEKGQDLKAKIARNFGCPLPEGYRKAMRLMTQAEKFKRPIVCLVDTQGAFCGKEAEERGMGNAIAESLAMMSGLSVPVVSVVIGEGGSGGALALAVANKVAMQENAVYSVLSPEGFASILWKDGSRAPEAAEVMKMSAADALALGIIEDVIPEGAAPAHENPDQAAAALWLYITNALEQLSPLDADELRSQRYDRFRKF